MKVIRLLFIFSLFIFSCTLSQGQSWLWAKDAFEDSLSTATVQGVVADKFGNVYETGYYYYSITFNQFTFTCNTYNTFVVKYDKNGNLLWAKQPNLGHQCQSYASSIAIDTSGNTYVFGTFNDTISFGKDTLIVDGTVGPFTGIFLVKYTPDGRVLWDMQSFPRNEYAYSTMVTTDSKSNVYLLGEFVDTFKVGNFMLTDTNYYENFLVKLNSDGLPLWANRTDIQSITNLGRLEESSISVDVYGNTYVAGTASQLICYFGPYRYIPQANSAPMFIAKYDTSGHVKWIKSASFNYLGGVNTSPYLATDKLGNLYITSGYGGVFIYDIDTLHYPGIPLSAFIMKLDSSGHSLWAFPDLFNTSIPDDDANWQGISICTDELNNVYLLQQGKGINADNPFSQYPYPSQYDIYIGNSVDSFNINNYAGIAALLLKFNSSGSLLCGTPINALNNTTISGQAIACIPTGSAVYVGGGLQIAAYLINSAVIPAICGYIGDSLLFGNDTIKFIEASHYVPYIAKWQPCCPYNAINYDTIKCAGTEINLTASGGTQYQWSTGNTTSSITVTPNNSTMYKVATIMNGCTDTIYNSIFVIPSPAINACCDSNITRGQSVSLSANGGIKYSWSPNVAITCDTCPNTMVIPNQTTTYTLTAINDSGCVATKYVTIDVSCGDVFVPDVFSPNASYNKILYVRGPCIAQLDFLVFDRWGNKVFESNNLDIGWDGNHNGTPMNMGTYMYYAKATMYDGSVIEKKGNVTLVR